MLLVLLALLLSSALLFLVLRHDRRSFLLFSMAASLAVFILGIMIFIAKRGGITNETVFILYGWSAVRRYLQYKVMTLGQLGYFIAIGRFLFPAFLLLTSLEYAYFPLALKLKRKVWLIFLPSLIFLVIYYPSLFRYLSSLSPYFIQIVVYTARTVVYGYIILSIAAVLHEYLSITSSFFKRKFIIKMMVLFSFAVVFALYAHQDPAQVYLFYSDSFMMNMGLWYMSAGFTAPMYIIVLGGGLAACLFGCWGTLRYLRVMLVEEREEVVLRRKANDAATGISMFIHGTKNDLIASRILISRIEKNGEGGEDLQLLKDVNTKLIKRMEKLYASVRIDSVHLEPVPLDAVIASAMQKADTASGGMIFNVKSPSASIIVLADEDMLSEALSDIMINAWEAEKAAGNSDPVTISIKLERLWVSVSVSDHGKGIDRKDFSRVWEPFFSSKNSSTNWGMGMYFTRKVMQMHLGSVRFESRPGHGTKFIALLPRYDVKETGCIE